MNEQLVALQAEFTALKTTVTAQIGAEVTALRSELNALRAENACLRSSIETTDDGKIMCAVTPPASNPNGGTGGMKIKFTSSADQTFLLLE